MLSLFFNERMPGLSLNPLIALSSENRSLFFLGATGTIPIDRFHRWWTLISANYLHGGILHILFNMIAFRQLAHFVIKEYGAYRMFTIYTLGGVLGFGVSYLAGVTFTIGASVSVCSLMGAIIFYGKSRGGIYGKAILTQISGWAIGLFIFGLMVPGINNWGHGGGMAAGSLLGFLLGYQEKEQETAYHKRFAIGCAVLTALILVWAVFTGIYNRALYSVV